MPTIMISMRTYKMKYLLSLDYWCMCVCLCTPEARREYQIVWSWSYIWLHPAQGGY